MERQDKSPEEAEYYRQLNSNVQNFGMYAYQQLQMQYQGVAGMYGGYNPMGAPNMMGMPQMMNMGYNPGVYMGGGSYKQYNQYNYNPHYQGGKGASRTNGGGGYNKVREVLEKSRFNTIKKGGAHNAEEGGQDQSNGFHKQNYNRKPYGRQNVDPANQNNQNQS